MKWMDFLKSRMSSEARKKLPEDVLLMDEIHAMYRVATEAAGVEMPATKKWLAAESARIHKKHMGNRSIEVGELIFRAKCIASVEELISKGATDEEARRKVSELGNAPYDKVARWHQEFDPTPIFDGEDRYNRNLPDKVAEMRLWIQRMRNQYSTEEAIAALFKAD